MLNKYAEAGYITFITIDIILNFLAHGLKKLSSCQNCYYRKYEQNGLGCNRSNALMKKNKNGCTDEYNRYY